MNTKWVEIFIYCTTPILLSLSVNAVLNETCDASICNDEGFKQGYTFGLYFWPVVFVGGYLSIGLLLRRRRLRKSVKRSPINT